MLIEKKKKLMPEYLQIFRAGLRCFGIEKNGCLWKKCPASLEFRRSLEPNVAR